MPQDAITQIINVEQLEYVNLFATPREVRTTQATFEKYQAHLGIEPNCVYICTSSLRNLREAVANVEHLKQHPALLVHPKSRVTLQASD